MRDRRILTLLALTAIFYLTWPTRVPECDAVIYASTALRGVREMQYDPGHLLLGSLEAQAVAIGRMARPPLNPVWLLPYLSMLASLLGIYAFQRTLVDLGVRRGRATLFAAVLAAGYAWWHFALQAESHILSTALLVIFLWRCCRAIEARTIRACAWAGLWLGFATLMHQKNVLLAGAALPALLLAHRGSPRGLRGAAAFLIVFVLVAVVPYLVVGWTALGLRRPDEFLFWARGLQTWSGWGGWSGSTLPKALIGMARSLVGGHTVLGLGPVQDFASRLFPRASMADEVAIAATVRGGMRVVVVVLKVIVFAAAGLALLRRLARPFVPGPQGAPLTVFLWGWVLIVGLFAAWWAPERAEFWLDVVPPLLLLVALPRAGARELRGGTVGLAAFAVALALVNFLGSIRPQSLATLEPESRVALALDAAVTPGDLVLADSPFEGRASCYARAFVPVDLATLVRAGGDGEVLYSRVDSLLARAEAMRRRVCLLVTPLAPGARAHRAHERLVARLGERYRIGEVVPVRADVELRRISLDRAPAR